MPGVTGAEAPLSRLPSFLATCATLILLAAPPGPAATSAATVSHGRASRALYDSALRRRATGAHEQRQIARLELERARALDPANLKYADALGRAYLDADMLMGARQEAESILAQDPANADAEYLLGLTWRRSWLIDPDSTARDRAILHLARAVRGAADDGSRWIPLVPLLMEAGRVEAARDAATLALRASPTSFEAQLLMAYTAQRTGDLARADQLFTAALARMPATVRALFEDVEPLIPEWAVESYRGLDRRERAELAARFWRDADPDPVTVENEAKLEFWARATHAYFLYYQPERGTWDLRGDLYVRYGPPARMERNPIEDPVAAGAGNWLTWTYPALGMRVWMEATNPLAGYRTPFTPGGGVVPARPGLAGAPRGSRRGAGRLGGVPEAASDGAAARVALRARPLRERLGFTAAGAGREPRLARRQPVGGVDRARLRPRGGRPRGAPDVGIGVLARGGAGGELRRGPRARALPRRPRGPRRARPPRRVPEGHRDPAIGERALSLSDVVVTCGRPEVSEFGSQMVRLEPDPGLRPAMREAITAYFEIYHLRPDSRGAARFEYACAVRYTAKDRRSWLERTFTPRAAPATIEMMREVESYGTLRRQYVSVPIRDLPPGDYQIEIRVRDLDSGEETTRLASFARGR